MLHPVCLVLFLILSVSSRAMDGDPAAYFLRFVKERDDIIQVERVSDSKVAFAPTRIEHKTFNEVVTKSLGDTKKARLVAKKALLKAEAIFRESLRRIAKDSHSIRLDSTLQRPVYKFKEAGLNLRFHELFEPADPLSFIDDAQMLILFFPGAKMMVSGGNLKALKKLQLANLDHRYARFSANYMFHYFDLRLNLAETTKELSAGKGIIVYDIYSLSSYGFYKAEPRGVVGSIAFQLSF